jgi:purine-binding chemotaxis protein CheW
MATIPSDSSRDRHVVFRLAGQVYALPTAAVEEVISRAELSSPPGAPQFLEGILRIGPRLISVVSLRRLWGLPDEAPGLHTPLILLKGLPVALQVDAAEGVVDFSRAELSELPDGSSFNECSSKLVRTSEGHVLVLSAERLLLQQEQRRLLELATSEQQRLSALEEPMTCP